jgi:hypothetical protein
VETPVSLSNMADLMKAMHIVHGHHWCAFWGSRFIPKLMQVLDPCTLSEPSTLDIAFLKGGDIIDW